MLALILAISLFNATDTVYPVRNHQRGIEKIFVSEELQKSQKFSNGVEIKSTQNIYYRLFTNDSALYFQYQAIEYFSEPTIIDKGNIPEYTMTTTNGNYIHIVWCKDGRVFYKINMCY